MKLNEYFIDYSLFASSSSGTGGYYGREEAFIFAGTGAGAKAKLEEQQNGKIKIHNIINLQ